MMGHTPLGNQQRVAQSLCLAYIVGRCPPDQVPCNGTVDSKSVVDIKPGDSGAEIWYQVD